MTDFGLAKRVEGPGRRRPHPVRLDRGHARLHGSRAGRGTARGGHDGRRRPRPGGDPLRAAHRPPPFRAETMLETLRLVREQEPERPSTINPKVDRDLETIVLKCLEKPPSRRYRSAEALAEDLERWLADLPIRARPATLPDRAVKWVRRRPAAAAFLLAASVAALAIALAVRELNSTARLRDDVAQKGLALLKEQAKRLGIETELAESRDRKARLEEDQYDQRILAVAQALANDDPLRDDPRQVERLLADCPPRLRNWEWRHLNRKVHAQLVTIQGHSGLVCALEFGPDTATLVCPQDSALGIPIWDAAASPKLRRIHGPDDRAYGVSFDRAGLHMATAGIDGQIKVWDLARARLEHAFRGHEGWAADVAFSPDGTKLASAGQDGAVRIWDVKPNRGSNPESGSPEQELRGHGGGVFGVAFAPDGTKLVSCGKDGTVRVWDLAQQPARTILVFRGHQQEVSPWHFIPPARWSPREGPIAGCGSGTPPRVKSGSGSRQRRPAASMRSRSVRTGRSSPPASLDGPIGVWHAGSGRPIVVLRGHALAVFEVAFSADGTKLISASQDATVKLWDLASEPGVRPFILEPAAAAVGSLVTAAEPAGPADVRWVGGVAFRPAGNELAAAGTNHTVALWDVATGRLQRTLHAPWETSIALCLQSKRHPARRGRHGSIRTDMGPGSDG